MLEISIHAFGGVARAFYSPRLESGTSQSFSSRFIKRTRERRSALWLVLALNDETVRQTSRCVDQSSLPPKFVRHTSLLLSTRSALWWKIDDVLSSANIYLCRIELEFILIFPEILRKWFLPLFLWGLLLVGQRVIFLLDLVFSFPSLPGTSALL